MNIAEYCIKKPTVTLSFAVAMLLAGIIGYFRLGRLEDPEFTIKACFTPIFAASARSAFAK